MLTNKKIITLGSLSNYLKRYRYDTLLSALSVNHPRTFEAAGLGSHRYKFRDPIMSWNRDEWYGW